MLVIFGIEGSILGRIQFEYTSKILVGLLINFCLILIWVISNIVDWGSYTPLEETGGSKIKKTAIIAGIIELLLLLVLGFSFWKYYLEKKISVLRKIEEGIDNDEDNEGEKTKKKLRAKKKIEEEEEEEEEDKSPRRRAFWEPRISNDGKATIRREEEEKEP